MEIYEFKERLLIIRDLGLIAISAFLVIFHISMLIGTNFGAIALIVWLLLLSAILGAAVLVVYNFKGLVQADQSGVNIKILLFGKSLSEHSCNYSEIRSVQCNVERHSFRTIKYYDMVFVIMLPGGKELSFIKRLKVRSNSDINDPSAFYSAALGEPMNQLCNYVMVNRKEEFDKKYPV